MAKVTKPLFDNFREAFGTTIVYQGCHLNNIIVRKKVVHPTDPTSAHYKTRASRWAKAVHKFFKDNPGNVSLINHVSRYALSPSSPANLRVICITVNPQNHALFDITFAWDAPTTKYGGHPMLNLAGYFVNFSPDGLYWQRLNSDYIQSTIFTDTRPFGTYNYSIQATDDQQNVSTSCQDIEVTTTITSASYGQSLYNTFLYAKTNPADSPQSYNAQFYDLFRYTAIHGLYNQQLFNKFYYA